MTYKAVRATEFTKNFAEMRKSAEKEGILLVQSHKRTIGAFVRPEIIKELEILRRKARDDKTLKDKHDELFDHLEQAAHNWHA